MKRNIMFLALATIGLASCNGGFKKGSNGMLYNIHVDKGGPKIKVGDFVSVNVIMKNDADSVLYSSYEQGRPAPLLVQKTPTHGDVMEAMQLLSEGDSATIKVFVDSQKMAKPPGFKGKYINYTIKVEKVISKGTLTDQVFQSKVTDFIKGQAELVKNLEPGKIKKYIDDNKLNVTKTDSGLYYVITKPGTGPVPAPGDTVYVNYLGKQTNGKAFDTNIKEEATKGKLQANPMNPNQYKPIAFPVGEKKVIPGWDQGLLLLNTGAKATFVIPSSLAYRDQGNGPIGPYTPLVFEVELVKIVHPNPNAPKPVAPKMMMPQPPTAKK